MKENTTHNNEPAIEKDRRCLRTRGENPDFSYLPYIEKTSKTTFKLSKLRTLNILYYLEEGFKIGDKVVISNLERIKKELVLRKDIFNSILIFLQNKKIQDDLFYWMPAIKPGKMGIRTIITNIFAFISEVVPDFVKRYKIYYIQNIITCRPFYNAFNFIEQRYPAEYTQFKTMKMDLELFEDCITGPIWLNEQLDYRLDFLCEYLRINSEIDISSDLKALLEPRASFIEFSIDSKSYVVSLERFNGLMEMIEKHKSFWMEMDVIDENWTIK